ncbi:YsnF/AvaK domain-containing protein [Anaerobacillus sp. CMMVII]|uniref:YsnF/AvaK domain-containing protein n=1 Tax=Anaerobacillus sp. CMMVII TaxID=2755588 RepID=UPI0021B7326D|nr:YsnF/AvaK domain-containing protein [Anaerobacillus sp. CMMVII]MCT8136480.1 YsnF/AvaK domain-containing protein [Anaerobacillus sp. CMMVII]
MGKLLLIGAVIGVFLSWVFNFTILLGLILGAFVGGIIYSLNAKRMDHITNKETIQLREEQLDIRKKRVQTGEVKIHKEVVEEQRTFTVPIRREEMVIEAGMDEEIRIPLKEEEIEINKHPVQVNDVSITKRQIEEIEQVKARLKKETAHYEVEGNADVQEITEEER